MQQYKRHKAGIVTLTIATLSLSAASIAIFVQRPGITTTNGRLLCAGGFPKIFKSFIKHLGAVMLLSHAAARWILIAVGIIFIASGLIVTSLYFANVIPAGYNWQGPLFLILGSIGFAAAYFGLRPIRPWALFVLAVVYIPWTIIGLAGDIRQGFWPLVIGEGVGLILVVSALITCMRRMYKGEQ